MVLQLALAGHGWGKAEDKEFLVGQIYDLYADL